MEISPLSSKSCKYIEALIASLLASEKRGFVFLQFSGKQLDGNSRVLKCCPNEEANFSNIATVIIGFPVEGRPILKVSPYCFSSLRALAAGAVISLQVILALLGLVDHKLNSGSTVRLSL